MFRLLLRQSVAAPIPNIAKHDCVPAEATPRLFRCPISSSEPTLN